MAGNHDPFMPDPAYQRHLAHRIAQLDDGQVAAVLTQRRTRWVAATNGAPVPPRDELFATYTLDALQGGAEHALRAFDAAVDACFAAPPDLAAVAAPHHTVAGVAQPGASLHLLAREADVDVARTTAANADLACAALVSPALSAPELRRFANAFNTDAQWVVDIALPTADLADHLTDYDTILHTIAARLHTLMGWTYIFVTLHWPKGRPPAPTQTSLTLIYNFKEPIGA